MDKLTELTKESVMLTVYFEEPFWVGVFQRISGGRLSACKVTFGAEPKDYQVYEAVQKRFDQLRFSPAVETAVKEMSRNPKRIQREVHRQVRDTGTGTKSQQALKLQQEQVKSERASFSREQRDAFRQQQFQLKQQKKKEKHRGR